ncbi:hypothetical protein [Nocardia wallacei]|uniref:hypothetical protein n=1 Tax=Nocardia wallacei TaxID=480035 RepID=UPI002457B5BF|nr:hypothetical protein [Nocardia wallacei]
MTMNRIITAATVASIPAVSASPARRPRTPTGPSETWRNASDNDGIVNTGICYQDDYGDWYFIL